MSIWDAPTTSHSQTAAAHRDTSGAPSVATTGTVERAYGTQAGPLLSAQGRGVRNGIPYGQSEQARVEALNAQYPFQPGVVARLRGASRSALGR